MARLWSPARAVFLCALAASDPAVKRITDEYEDHRIEQARLRAQRRRILVHIYHLSFAPSPPDPYAQPTPFYTPVLGT
jgi:hypothetical protein